ncbi:MAG: DUF3105 domain-containing protein [Actinomycetota bacterium]
MASSKRETKRERREDAKRRRLEELRRRQRQARLRKMAMTGVAGLVIAGIVALFLVLGGDGNSEASNRLAAAAGCEPVENPKILTSTHIQPPDRETFNTNPPTSGRHYNAAGVGPLTTGIHRAAVQYEGSVHNIEHGHIAIYYKESVGPAIATILAEVVRGDPEWIMLAPAPADMPSQVAFTAWGHLQQCNTPNEQGLKAAADDFVKRFRDKAPESIKGSPEPGTDSAVPPTTASSSPTASPSPSQSPTST